MIRNICIYAGHRLSPREVRGPYFQSVDKHTFMFQEVNCRLRKNWNIRHVEGKEIPHVLSQIALQSTLLVIPAGESSELDKVFSKEETAAIQRAVKEGLHIYGTCGSAYWMCRERVWNDKCLESPNEGALTIKKSPLPLFEGLGVGPLSPYPGETYNTAFYHESIQVVNPKRSIQVLLSGGGTFIPDDSSTMEVLAWYAPFELKRFHRDMRWKAVVVKQGRVILSMIHPGTGANEIHVEAYQRAFPHRKDDWEKIRDSLSSLEERMAFLGEILEAFNW